MNPLETYDEYEETSVSHFGKHKPHFTSTSLPESEEFLTTTYTYPATTTPAPTTTTTRPATTTTTTTRTTTTTTEAPEIYSSSGDGGEQ